VAFPQGINFRQTSGFVTDGANEDFQIGQGFTPDYPRTTAQGNTVGWEGVPVSDRDRNSGVDRRLAGITFVSGSPTNYRIDLPASGSYNIRLAAGDATYGQGVNTELFDNTSSLGVLSSGSTSGGSKYKDATNTEYSAAAWPGSNTAVAKTFSSTICRLKLGTISTLDVVAHFYIEAAGGGGGGTTYFKTVGGTITMSGAVEQSIRIHKMLAGSITSTGTLRKMTRKSFAGSVTAAGTITKRTKKSLSGSLTATGALVKKTMRKLAGSITPSGNLVEAFTFKKSLAGSILMSGALSTFKYLASAGSTVLAYFPTLRRFIGRR
jgi:hypothetical protein